MGATNLTFSATQLIAIVIVSPGRFDGFVRALPGVLMAITTYEGRAGICMHAQLVVVFRGRAARAGQPDLDEVRDVFFFQIQLIESISILLSLPESQEDLPRVK
jgi:hypothetical protein